MTRLANISKPEIHINVSLLLPGQLEELQQIYTVCDEPRLMSNSSYWIIAPAQRDPG
jgi:hypothetical protein